MKNVYIIGGTMGVGKTACCNLLMNNLDDTVFLDGDWCWKSNPFQVTDDTRKMVLDNIVYLLNNYIHCPAYQSCCSVNWNLYVYCLMRNLEIILEQTMTQKLDRNYPIAPRKED